MSEAIAFLHALAQVLATMSLYSPGHPAAKRGLEAAWQALTRLLEADEHPVFLFLGGAPVFAGRPLHEMRDWPYTARLSNIGVQRLEFEREATLEAFSRFLANLQGRFSTGATGPLEEEAVTPGITSGLVVVQQAEEEEVVAEEEGETEGSREYLVNLDDELEVVQFIWSQAGAGTVARAEAEAVVRLLATQLESHTLPQVAHSSDFGRYHAEHAVNTSLLAMAVARQEGFNAPGRQQVGVAAILHDIGVAQLPAGLFSSESLNEAERQQVESHPRLGARLLMRHGGRGMELAAQVAWEHHLRPDGTGYPIERFRAVPGWTGKVVGVCATYVALRSPRPFRQAWGAEQAVRHLEAGAGVVFDAEAARVVCSVVRPS